MRRRSEDAGLMRRRFEGADRERRRKADRRMIESTETTVYIIASGVPGVAVAPQPARYRPLT